MKRISTGLTLLVACIVSAWLLLIRHSGLLPRITTSWPLATSSASSPLVEASPPIALEIPIAVQDCGRSLLAFPPSASVRTILLRTLLPSLAAHHYCLDHIVSDIGVEATTTDGGMLISLFDRDDPAQARYPFEATFNVFVVSGQQVFIENPFDGSLEILPHMTAARSSAATAH